MKPHERIIFPLDVPTAKEAFKYVDILKGKVGVFKIGLELFISEGPSIVKEISKRSGAGIFLDMKLHDIPVTVARAVAAAIKLKIDFLTFHPEEGSDLIDRLPQDIKQKTTLLGITLLTSSLVKTNSKIYTTSNSQEICLYKAGIALQNGAGGVVCSPLEAATIKRTYPELTVITPGIRPFFSIVSRDDQKRAATPADAIRAGADFLVIGRPIRDAQQPDLAAEKVAEEIMQAKPSDPAKITGRRDDI